MLWGLGDCSEQAWVRGSEMRVGHMAWGGDGEAFPEPSLGGSLCGTVSWGSRSSLKQQALTRFLVPGDGAQDVSGILENPRGTRVEQRGAFSPSFFLLCP